MKIIIGIVIGFFLGSLAAGAARALATKDWEQKYNQCMAEKTAVTNYCAECMLDCKSMPRDLRL